MTDSFLFICIDGWDPSYLENGSLPNLSRIRSEGYFKTIQSTVPTVTNVNHVSILTGAYPEKHGVIGNYSYNRDSGRGFYMETPESITSPLISERLQAAGVDTILLTVKAKLSTLLGKGMTQTVSAEEPPADWISKLGKPGSIYKPEANIWLFKALPEFLDKAGPKFIYLATTDYVTHHHGPKSREAVEYFESIDRAIGEILNRYPDLNLCVTADHGMKEKRRAIDPGRLLTERGIKTVTIPIIKDRYVIHHQNLGGACYLFLDDSQLLKEAISILAQFPGVESALGAKDAARKYHLPINSIGDVFVLGDETTVFGELEEIEREVKLRSHGSLHEQSIPFFGWGPVFGKVLPCQNREILTLIKF